MFGIPWIEWIGYSASVLIAVSLLMKDMKKLRVINSIGCIVFVIYGLGVTAYPVAISNFIILLINIYQLYELKKR